VILPLRFILFQIGQVPVEPSICQLDQCLIEPSLAHTRFATADQQDRFATWIKRKRDSLDAAICTAAQLFHIGVAGAIKRINVGPAQLRSKSAKHSRLRD
jgi:hypothetical protein